MKLSAILRNVRIILPSQLQSARTHRAFLLALALSLVACPSLKAGTFTWDGTANDNEWQSNGNWAGVGGAGADDDLVFPVFASQKANHNGFTTNTRFHSILFQSPEYAITGNQIFLSAGIVANYGQPGNEVEFTPNIILDADQTFSGVAHALHLNGVVNLNGHNLTSDGGGGVIYDGFINGTGTLVVPGTATINGNSSAFGTTTVTGRLIVNSPGILGAITLNGGTYSGSGTVGAITINAVDGGTIAPGQSSISAILTANGDVTMNSATTLTIEVGGTTAGTQHDQFKVTGHNLNLNNAKLHFSLINSFVPVVGQQFTIVLHTGAGSISGQFIQGTHLTAAGRIYTITYSASNVVLTYVGNDLTWGGGGANNNWATGTNWNFGFAPENSLGLIFPAGASGLGNNNNLFINAQNLQVNGITFSGGGYAITGNPIDLAVGITNTAASGGAITFSPNIRMSQNLTFLNNGQSETLSGQLDMNGLGLTVDGTVLQTLSGAVIGTPPLGQGGIVKNGTGTLRLLSASNTYSGETIINAGTIEISTPNSLGLTTGPLDDTVVNSGATLRLLTSITVAESIGLHGTGTAGVGALTESGCDTGCNLTGDVSLGSSSTINVPNSGHKLTLSGRFNAGAFGVTKIGPGTLILANTSPNPSFTGTINVSAGTLLVNGSNANAPVSLTGGTLGGSGTIGPISITGGTVAPGASAGTLNVNGNSTFSTFTTFFVEIGGTGAATFDQLNVTGTLNIGAGISTLSGTLINGFVPTPGQQFTIIQSSGALTGAFAQGSSVNIGGTLFSITYNANSVVLTAQGGTSPTPTATATASPTATASATATPTATATATATGSPIATATASPSATSTPNPTTLANISTRLRVETGDNVLIGGFIITGTQPKRVIAVATGPSLTAFGVPGALANPTLELFQGDTPIESNDNWKDSIDSQAIINSTVAPSDDFESAVIATLPANNSQYTAVVRGANDGTGVGTVQFFDLDRSVDSRLANISTRGFVQTGANVLIAGTIVLGTAPQKVLLRAIGPSLPFPGTLQDPTLELRDGNGDLLDSNDNWKDSPNKQAIIDSTIPPTNDAESAIVATLPAGGAQYTAIVRGVNDTTGIAVVEIYALQ